MKKSENRIVDTPYIIYFHNMSACMSHYMGSSEWTRNHYGSDLKTDERQRQLKVLIELFTFFLSFSTYRLYEVIESVNISSLKKLSTQNVSDNLEYRRFLTINVV